MKLLILLCLCFGLFTVSAQKRKKITKEELLKHYDLTNASFKRDDLFVPGVKKDGIPSLTKPPRLDPDKLTFLNDQSRIALVTIKELTVGYPIDILTFHEIVNDDVNGLAIAVTYCPLCNSVSIFERRINDQTLEFGVSGFLYNSNVVMYDRQTNGLWSQVFMKGLSGKYAGKELKHLPLKLLTLAEFKKQYPKSQVMGPDPKHKRPYGKNPYKKYFESDKTYRQGEYSFNYGKAIGSKVLGLGIAIDDKSWFISQKYVGEKGYTMKTAKGDIKIKSSPAGLYVDSLPDAVYSMQTFYHSWSAFFPKTLVIAHDSEKLK